MIWRAGRVVPDDDLKISPLDRTFEHGLGLFETLRSWDGVAPLLDRHLARLCRSAEALSLPLVGVEFPDPAALAALRAAESSREDRVLRVTLTGGTSGSGGATLWVRSGPLPPPARAGGAHLTFGRVVDPDDDLLRHKTLNYWSRRADYDRAVAGGFDESLSVTGGDDPRAWEGSRSNLFAVIDGRLLTPDLAGPIVPGIMRGLVIETAAALGFDADLVPGLAASLLGRADEVFLTNSVRGVTPVARLGSTRFAAPGPRSVAIRAAVTGLLSEGRML